MSKKIFFIMIYNILVLQIFGQENKNIDSLKLILPLGHASIINDAIETSDFKYLITCSDDNSVNIWNIKAGKLVNTLLYHTKRVNGLDYDTLTGKFLTYSDDNSLCLWSIYRKEPEHIFKTTSKINRALINSTKNEIIAVSDDNYIYCWNLITGKIKNRIKKHNGGISNMVITNDGRRVIIFDRSGFFKVWDTKNWSCLYTQKHGCSLPMIVKKYVNNDNIFFTAYDSTIIEYNPYYNKVVNTFTSDGIGFLDFSVSYSRRYLVVSRYDKWIHVIDRNKKDEILYKKKLSAWGYSISISPKEDRFSIGVQDGNTIEIKISNESESFRKYEKENSIEKVKYLNQGAIVFTGSKNGKIELIESGTGKTLFSLSSKTNVITSVGIAGTQNSFLTGTSQNVIGSINYMNWNYGPMNFEKHLSEYGKFEINNSVNRLAAFNYKKLAVYDYVNQKLLYEIKVYKGSIYKVGFDYSGNLLYTINNDKIIRIYNANSGLPIDSFNINNGYDYITASAFSLEDSLLYLGTSEGGIYVYKIDSHKLIYEKYLTDEFINNIFYDRNSLSIIVVSDHNIFVCKENLDVMNKKYEPDYIMNAMFLEDKNCLLIGKKSGIIDFYQPKFNLTSKNIKVGAPIKFITSLISKNLIGIVLLNGSIQFWDYNSGKNIGTLLLLEKSNWLIKLPNSRYFMCSKDASKMIHYVTPNLKIIGFDQLDPVYNRPDIVLDSIGNYFGSKDSDNIQKYRQAWERRIDRLQLDRNIIAKGDIAVPEANIVNEENISSVSSDSILKIKIHANDQKYKLKRFNIIINEVPLYGSAGISITTNERLHWDTTISITLNNGENKIQVSVLNELGLENFKYTKYVKYASPNIAPVSRTHYIGIGIDKFKDPKLESLDYCVKDVNDLGIYFNVPNNKIKILTNENVTKENILSLKRYLKDSTNINDRVIISCSSHGILDKMQEFYLAMYDMDINQPETKGLSYKDLESLLDDIPARKKLLLLDACYSGENDKTEVIRKDIELNKETLNKELTGRALKEIQEIKEENKNKFLQVSEIFINVRNNTGSVIISAAGGQQKALEGIDVMVNGKGIQNGAFTYSVLEYLRQNESQIGNMTVNKLKEYVEKRVEEITVGRQKPTSRQETMEIDWNLN